MKPTSQDAEPATTDPTLTKWVRGSLLVLTVAMVGVFVIAAKIEPYAKDGAPLRMESHRQLGLPPCTFYLYTGYPCACCGMTTSFALLVRGDVWNSLCANAVGTLIAAFCLGLIPWNLASAWRGRPVFIRSIEPVMFRILCIFMVLTMLRWAIVVAAIWADRAV